MTSYLKHLSAAEKSEFTDILGETTYKTAQYRQYSDLLAIHSQSFCGWFSSGCTQSANQHSPTEKAVEWLSMLSYKMMVHVSRALLNSKQLIWLSFSVNC